jgi:ArsR family transcriptional regulator, arsenate/arsenite/antimonite-responsive transcriptional repressor
MKSYIFVSYLDEILNEMNSNNKYLTSEQEKISRYAKALSHPVRVFVLNYLADNLDKCCYSGDMAEELPIARSTLSEHLKELKKSGLIQGEINPPFIKYCINRQNWEEAHLMLSEFFMRNKSESNPKTCK